MKFSIIIALAPNRSAPVLESIKQLNYKKDYEVIIKKGLNPSENRNKGIKEAKGEILAIVDDDCIVDKNWLKNAEEFFDKYPDVDLVGGPQLTPDTDNLFAKVSGYVMSSIFGSFNMRHRYKKSKLNLNADEPSLTSANLFIKKKVFEKTSAFDTSLWPGEDAELLRRLKNLGSKIAYSPDIIIYHKRRPDFSSFFKQFFNYGKVYIPYKKKLEEKISLLHLMPTFFVLYLIISPLLYLIHTLFIFPLLLYFFLVFIFSTSIIIKNKHFAAFPYLPFLFFAIHVSYGLGLIRGLFK